MKERIKLLTGLILAATAAAAYARLYPAAALLHDLVRIRVEPSIPFFRHMTHLLLLALTVLSANGWGVFFWKRRGLSTTERFVFATGAGLGVMALITFGTAAVGTAGGFQSFTVMAGGAGILLAEVLRTRPAFRIPRPKPVPLILASVPLSVSLAGALAPPTQFDSLVYHLTFPARYLQQGEVYRIPDSIFAGFPQNLEMLFLYGLALDGDILANLLGWLFLPLTAAAVHAFAGRYAGRRTALLSALVWLYTPSLLLLATGTYVDLGLTLFIFLAAYAVLLEAGTGSLFWAGSAGAFAGLALGTKYTAGIPVLLFSAVMLHRSFRSKSVAPAAVFGTAVLALFSPWLLKNLLLLHNPVAPWGTALMHATAADQVTATRYFEHMSSHGPATRGIIDVLTLPWKLTAHGFSFGGGFDIPGPLFIMFVPALFLKPEIDRIEKVILVFGGLFFLFWAGTARVLRFLVPLFPFLSVLAGAGLARLAERRLTGIAARTLFGLAAAHNILLFLWVSTAAADPWPIVLGGESRDRYLTRKVDCYGAVRKVNGLPPGSRVLFWGETRGYYARKECIVPTEFDVHPLVEWANGSASYDELAARIADAGVTHVFVNSREVARLGFRERFTPVGKRNWAELKLYRSRTVYRDDYCRVYEIVY